MPIPYSVYEVDPSFQEVNRLILSFENNIDRTVHTNYYFRTLEIEDYNFMINLQNFFNQLVKLI